MKRFEASGRLATVAFFLFFAAVLAPGSVDYHFTALSRLITELHALVRAATPANPLPTTTPAATREPARGQTGVAFQRSMPLVDDFGGDPIAVWGNTSTILREAPNLRRFRG